MVLVLGFILIMESNLKLMMDMIWVVLMDHLMVLIMLNVWVHC